MENNNVKNVVHGFKVFKSDWTCSPNGHTKQYTCPGKFEEEGKLDICSHGMHFCQSAADCFNYCSFDTNNKVAEVIAYGEVITDGNKSCTNKLMIVREIPWDEVLRIVNIGKNCTGRCNTGDWNAGNWNTGHCNTGDYNTGDCNTGDYNTGDYNNGDYNTGDYNTGHCNTGDWNVGNSNTGNRNTGSRNVGNRNVGNRNVGNRNVGYQNIGNRNTGDYNTGDRNTGDWNAGNWNTGHCNTGDYNTGDYNTGDYNTGDWNKSSRNTGCFNTEEQNIVMFNKMSNMTYSEWMNSEARYLLNQMPKDVVEWVYEKDMTDEEKVAHPSYTTTHGYLKVLDGMDCGQLWWNTLSDRKKNIIKSIPNFDADIFFQCTGIRVDKVSESE